MDRRGRGASGDGPAYSVEREFEDVAAVVDSIAETSGSPVDVYGHSYGGECAFGAALLTSNIGRLVLYEGWPPVTPQKLVFPRDVEERLDALVAAGENEAALETFMRDIVKVSEEELAAIRAQPSWPARVAAAPTITREIRAFFGDRFDPARAASIAVPVLILAGADTPVEIKDDPEAVAAALPDARLVVDRGSAASRGRPRAGGVRAAPPRVPPLVWGRAISPLDYPRELDARRDVELAERVSATSRERRRPPSGERADEPERLMPPASRPAPDAGRVRARGAPRGSDPGV